MTDSNDDDLFSRIVRDLAAREKVFRDARESIERARMALQGLGPQQAAVEMPTARESVGGYSAPASGIKRVSSRTPREIPPEWFKVKKVCPRCKKEKNVGRDFGLIVRNGVTNANSWCKQCRSEAANEYQKKKRAENKKH